MTGISCTACKLDFGMDIFTNGVTEGDCPQCGKMLKVIPSMRPEVMRVLNDIDKKSRDEVAALQAEPYYNINVLSSGKTITLDVKSWYTIDTIKSRIQHMEGIPKEKFDLVMFGKGRLEVDKELTEYNIVKESHLHLILEQGFKKVPLKGSVLVEKEIHEAFGGPGSWGGGSSESSAK
jgi:hypothetical protein